MFTMNRKVTLYIPETRMDLPSVIYGGERAAEAAGGCTKSTVEGLWIDPLGATVTETVIKHEFISADDNYELVRELAYIIYALMREGEQAVLLEMHAPYFTAVLFSKEDFGHLEAVHAAEHCTLEMLRGLTFGTELDA